MRADCEAIERRHNLGMRETRTSPLWGLRASAPYLHNGHAPTIDAAIRAHDGEAKVACDRYNQLPPQTQQQLIDFCCLCKRSSSALMYWRWEGLLNWGNRKTSQRL